MIIQDKAGYTKVTPKRRRKRIVPNKTVLCTKQGNTIELTKYLKKEEVSNIPGLKAIWWEYKGKVIKKELF